MKCKPRDHQLDEVIPENSKLMKPMRPKMQPPAQRIGDRLRLVVKVETRQVAPARIATELNQTPPSMIRKISQRNSQITSLDGGRRGKGRPSRRGQRKIARKPVSKSCISQPYPYQSC